MPDLRRVAAAAALSALLLTAAACSSSDDSSDGATDDATDQTTGDTADDTSDASADGEDAAGDGNPCEAVTQAQWEEIFGADVTKSDASGGADNCNVLTSGTSPGHEIALTNLSTIGDTTFDEAVSTYPPCSGTPEEVEVGDRAVLDTSCLELSGAASIVVQDGDDVLLISLDLAEPAEGDPADIGATFTEVATGIVASR